MESNGHDWRALVTYKLTPDDALRMTHPAEDDPGEVNELWAGESPPAGDNRPFLGSHNIVQEEVAVVCLNCEMAFTVSVAQAQCPGDPDAYAPDGTPLRDGAPVGGPIESNVPAGNLRPVQRPGRNDPCPCGSGKKWKHCHGQ